MIKIIFKNVGQGDSIILEWVKDGKNYLGIVDCNIFDGINPTLEHLKAKTDYIFEFIILSHFHNDHFSGMADIFNHCITNNIRVNYFYHTMAPFILGIYDKIFTSKKIEKNINDFIEYFDEFDKFLENKVPAHSHIKDIILNNTTQISFLAPIGKTYDELSLQYSRKKNRITTSVADINKLSTILLIKNGEESIILTSDTVKKSFERIRNIITSSVVLAQVPHHGSRNNHDDVFWGNIVKKQNCPAVFSVGDVPRDKLPNEEVVKFFDNNNFDIYSTNYVFGLEKYFNNQLGVGSSNSLKKTYLNTFSKLKNSTTNNKAFNKFSGDQSFNCF